MAGFARVREAQIEDFGWRSFEPGRESGERLRYLGSENLA